MNKGIGMPKCLLFVVVVLLIALSLQGRVYAALDTASQAGRDESVAVKEDALVTGTRDGQAKINWAGARVILSSYSIIDNDISDGTIKLRLILKNESAFYDAHSVLVTYTCDKNFYPAYGGSNQFFIPQIPEQSRVEQEITLAVDASTSITSFTMDFTVDFVDATVGKTQNKFFIGGLLGYTTNTIRLSSIEASGPIVPSGETPVHIAAYNSSEFDVKNVELLIGSLSQESVMRIPIGDIGAGESIEQELSLLLPESRVSQITAAFAYIGPDEAPYATKEESFALYRFQDPAAVAQAQAAVTQSLTASQLISLVVYGVLAIITLMLIIIISIRKQKL